MSSAELCKPDTCPHSYSEPVTAWVESWQRVAPHVAVPELADRHLRIRSAGDGGLLFVVSWDGAAATVAQPDVRTSDRFVALPHALLFLDAVLQHYVVRVSDAAACA